MTRVAVLTVLISSLAFAQEGEFELPSFDAPDTAAPDAGPPPAPREPPTPTWLPIGGSLSAMFTAFQEYFMSAELTVLYTALGTPQPSLAVADEVEGWLLQVGGTTFIGAGGGPLCDGTVFCAVRGGVGAAMKVGWARGMPSVSTGVTRTQTMYFGQVDVLFSHFGIESAPLSPGVKTPELLTRLRLGLHLTTNSSRQTSTGFTFLFAAVVQGVPLSRGTQGVSFGLSVGVGF